MQTSDWQQWLPLRGKWMRRLVFGSLFILLVAANMIGGVLLFTWFGPRFIHAELGGQGFFCYRSAPFVREYPPGVHVFRIAPVGSQELVLGWRTSL